jgi:hypothetical protein
MKKILNILLISTLFIAFFGSLAILPGYLFISEKKPESYDRVSIDMVFASGHARCATYKLPSNRKGFGISSSRGSYYLTMSLPTRLGSGVSKTIRNGVIDYQIVESC